MAYQPPRTRSLGSAAALAYLKRVTKRPTIVFARPPSRTKRHPKPAQPAEAMPARMVYAPKRKAPPLPSGIAEPEQPFDRDARADAADRLWRELVQQVKGEGGS